MFLKQISQTHTQICYELVSNFSEYFALKDMIYRCLTTCLVLLITLVIAEAGLVGLITEQLNKMWFKHKNPATPTPTDDDVIKTAEDVATLRDLLNDPTSEKNPNVLTVDRLSKFYNSGNKYAVRAVSFGVRRGECFGLLGVNGAGKSTLFQMLCGFHPPSGGDAFLLGINIFSGRSRVSEHMSYCPQHDVLFEAMSVHEHLDHYARIRGIRAIDRQDVISTLIDDVGLTAHVDKAAGALSGGNKRKLNFAISMLDYPEVIFLDEMTTG